MAVGYEDVAYEIPKSRGMPPVVRWLFLIGLVVIFFMGAITVVGSWENHVWPADQTPTVPLSGKL
jgi:hypothetical protein